MSYVNVIAETTPHHLDVHQFYTICMRDELICRGKHYEWGYRWADVHYFSKS